MTVPSTTTPASRRALLAASLGAVAASVATALGRPAPARAATGTFDSSDATPAVSATTTHTSGTGVYGYASAVSGITYGMSGQSDSTSGTGLFGWASAASGFTYGVWGQADSTDGLGVYGRANAPSGTTIGVYGEAASPSGTGVYGWASPTSGATVGVVGRVVSPDGTAVFGYSGVEDLPVVSPKTGVYGIANQDGSSRGVHGYSSAGRGVYGQASTGQGVRGYATGSTGTAGYFSTPTSAGLHTGTALVADGRVKFPNCVGIATIASTLSSVAVSPGIDLTSSSVVTATLMGSAGGTTTVHRVGVNPSANTFTIFLTAPVTTASVKVGWHVFG